MGTTGRLANNLLDAPAVLRATVRQCVRLDPAFCSALRLGRQQPAVQFSRRNTQAGMAGIQNFGLAAKRSYSDAKWATPF